MRTNRRAARRPSKDQVRAWLTTVIAPMVSALTVERQRVTRGNWSFRCETQDFEFLWPVDRMISVQCEANLEQLLRYRAELQALIRDHDIRLDALRTVARRTFDRLRQYRGFHALASASGASERDQCYFAEYVINGLRDLPSYHTTHEFWTREGAQFLDLRREPALQADFASLDEAGRTFLGSLTGLLDALKRLQVELADRYKLPPVDPSDAVRV